MIKINKFILYCFWLAILLSWKIGNVPEGQNKNKFSFCPSLNLHYICQKINRL
jgi:hypothetical protein